MKEKTMEELRKEFEEEYCNSPNETIINNPTEISDWWINKINTNFTPNSQSISKEEVEKELKRLCIERSNYFNNPKLTINPQWKEGVTAGLFAAWHELLPKAIKLLSKPKEELNDNWEPNDLPILEKDYKKPTKNKE